jgi:hypothetical protein
MNRRQCAHVFVGIALPIALGGCSSRPTAALPTYFEASAPDSAPAARKVPSYADSVARYVAVVEQMHGSGVWLGGAAEALEDLADAVATLPGAANDGSGPAIRAHAQQVRLVANDPAAARHEVGLALAVAANAFDAAARITHAQDGVLAATVADVRTDIYPVVTDETQADHRDVVRALVGMERVLRAYENALANGG